MPEIRRPELNKQEGVCYAVSDDGLELPVIDVTHPAFELKITPERERAVVQRFLEEQRRFARLPSLAQKLLLRFFMRGSVLGPGLRRAEGTFLDGMTTYLCKVGPKNLGEYATPVDRRIAASLPGLGLRLRLADMAQLLADCVAEQLAHEPGRALYLLNIAGGPAIDSLNALIVLQHRRAGLLQARSITLCVLDCDERGPAFGARALAALQRPGAPLAGLRIEFRRLDYDWRHVARLAPALEAANLTGASVVASSEGGLFEYGSDDDISTNLRALAAGLGSSFRMVGSVTRDDETIRTLKLTSTAATRPRGLAAFTALAASAGFEVSRAVARPLSDQVVLAPVRTS